MCPCGGVSVKRQSSAQKIHTKLIKSARGDNIGFIELRVYEDDVVKIYSNGEFQTSKEFFVALFFQH